jgi:alkylation response protein AidB-like acyl-CoA dehydrogenase
MTNAVDHMLAEIRKLAPEIPSRAAEIKTARRMPPDLVDKLKEIGLYRMFVPRSHGGLELDFPEGVRATAELGKIEGSLGWTAMIAMGSGLVTSLLPLETYNRVYENGPDVTLAGSSQPAGTAEAVPGGGRWPFASGCQQAEWMLTFCIMTKDGKPLAGSAGDDGPPLVRGFILPASEWQIEDTWHVAGLKGTGSITLRSRTSSCRRRASSISRTPCRVCPGRSIRLRWTSFR